MPSFFNTAQADLQTQANRAISYFDRSPSKSKRRRFQKRMDFYNGVMEEYLKDDINKNYKYPDRLKLQLEYDGLTEFLIKEVAAVYNENPIRKVIDGTEKDQEIMNDIWQKSKLDLIMQEVNRMVKLHKTVIVRVCWRDESIQYDILTPNVFEVINNVDNNLKIEALLYVSIYDLENDTEYLNNDRKRTNEDRFDSTDAIFHYWTGQNYIEFRRKTRSKSAAKITFDAANEDFVNPYGIIPAVALWDGIPHGDFYKEGGDTLITKNSIINQKLTEKNYLTKQQSFSNMVRKGAPQGAEPLISDPSLTIDVPADTDTSKGNDVKYITPEAKIDELSKDIERKKREIAIEYKLNPDMFTASAQRSSSQSLQLQNAQQAKIIKADKPFYSSYEKDIFNVTRIIWNTHNPGNRISDTAALFIDYKESETIMTLEERDNHNIVLETNGIRSKIDWIMDENPDITDRESAMEFLKKIAEEKAELAKINMDMFGLPMMPPPEPESGDEDEDGTDERLNDDNPIGTKKADQGTK